MEEVGDFDGGECLEDKEVWNSSRINEGQLKKRKEKGLKKWKGSVQAASFDLLLWREPMKCHLISSGSYFDR